MLLNETKLVGVLGADPEVRHTAGGNQVVNLRLAVTDFRGSEKITYWFKVVAFGKTAEKVVDVGFERGDEVYINGKSTINTWEDKEGRKRYDQEIVAFQVQHTQKPGSRKGDAGQSRPAGGYAGAEADDDDSLPF